jgi:hypothetical protein
MLSRSPEIEGAAEAVWIKSKTPQETKCRIKTILLIGYSPEERVIVVTTGGLNGKEQAYTQ